MHPQSTGGDDRPPKTVLLLGAGWTRAAAGQSAKAKRPPLDADFFGIARAVDKAEAGKVADCLHALVGDYSTALLDSRAGSLETVTTYLYLKARESRRRDPYHRGFLDLLTLLTRVLAETTNKISAASPSLAYRFLWNELRALKTPDDLTIITFNYDLLIERVLDEIAQSGHAGAFRFPGCYRLSEDEPADMRMIRHRSSFKTIGEEPCGVAVLKLHGSLNWHSAHNSRDTMPHEMYNISRGFLLSNSPIIHDSLILKKGRRTAHLKPVIIPPVSGKDHVMHEQVKGLWRRAADALQSADRLVIAGYSCPPLDIESRMLISESLRAGRLQSVHVINPDMKLADTFARLCGVDNAIAYKDLPAWMQRAYR